MSELSPDEDEYLISIPEAVHYTADGIITEADVYSNMEAERQREVIAGALDIPLEKVLFADEASADPRLERARRISVAFSSARWSSSWDPDAAKGDPNLN
jgi:hypothetical protein